MVVFRQGADNFRKRKVVFVSKISSGTRIVKGSESGSVG